MKKTVMPTALAQKHRNQWLNVVMIFSSLSSLFLLFYLNGVFSPKRPETPPPAVEATKAFKLTGTASVSDVTTKTLAFKAMLPTTRQTTYSASLARYSAPSHP